jgi:hypothetical protein
MINMFEFFEKNNFKINWEKNMKKIFIGALLLGSVSTFAAIDNDGYEYERETFKGKFTKIGKSFVCMPAYRKAKEKAWQAGYSNCSQTYKYNLTNSWFTKDEVTCKAYVECGKRVRVETIESGEAEI